MTRDQIVGDIHGQICDVAELLRVCERAPTQAILANGRELANSYLFMGDYVDRGWYGTGPVATAGYIVSNILHTVRRVRDCVIF